MHPADLARAARHRVAVLLVLAVLAFGAIGGRLFQLQVLDAGHYTDLALAQRLSTVPLKAERGGIFDRNGSDLAISIQQQTIWADPRLVTDPAGEAATLAPIVGVDAPALTARLGQRDKQFVYVARTVPDDVAGAVRELDLPGIDFMPESKRHYPAGTLAAPLLGTVGTDGTGLAGLEYEYESLLRGKPGELVVERDRAGRDIPRTVRRDVPARRGTDLVLTIDEALQYQVEQSLTDQVAASHAQGGMAVVIDTRTGDVLAMATVDGASGSQPAHPAGPTERNRPMTDVFEPGSTNKVVTMSAAMQAGLIGPDTTFDVPWTIRVGDSTFRDDEQHPPKRWTTTDCLRESSNVCTIEIAQALGKDRLDAALRAYGLGSPTAARFPGQAAGILLPKDKYYGVGIASVPIGYGVAVSTLQMLDVYATIAHDGVTVPPRLVEATIDSSGARHDRPISAGHRVVDTRTAHTMQEMLRAVVRGGTGTCAAVPGYTVAGKTGTSRIPNGSGGYGQGHMASFIGFAPAERPRLAAAVVIESPDTTYGGRASAPVFSEIMRFALRLDRIAPASTPSGPSQYEAAMRDAADQGVDCRVPHPGGTPGGTAPTASTGSLTAPTSPSG